MDGTERYRAALDDLLFHHEVDATSRTIGADAVDGPIHCLDTGASHDERPPVLCLHGNGTPGADWVPLLPALADRRVLVPERPGHGCSAPLDYGGRTLRAVNASVHTAVLDELDVTSAVVVGNSFGGYHALSLALADPDRVDRLVVAGAPAGIDPKPPMATRLFGVPGIDRLWYRVTVPRDVDDARTVYRRINVHDPAALSTAFLEAYLAATRVPGRRRTLLSGFRSIVGLRGFAPSFLFREELPSIQIPTRFVWGDDDYFGDQQLGREVARTMPDAEFVGVDAAGHMPWLEPGDDGRDAILGFL